MKTNLGTEGGKGEGDRKLLAFTPLPPSPEHIIAQKGDGGKGIENPFGSHTSSPLSQHTSFFRSHPGHHSLESTNLAKASAC